MKKNILFSFSLFLSCFSIAQPNLLQFKAEIYNPDLAVWENDYELNWRYNSQGNLVYEDATSGVESGRSQTTYAYHSNGQLSYERRESFEYGSVVGAQTKGIGYYYNAAGLIELEADTTIFWEFSDPFLYKRNEYEYDGQNNLVGKIFKRYCDETDTYYISTKVLYEYNEENQIIWERYFHDYCPETGANPDTINRRANYYSSEGCLIESQYYTTDTGLEYSRHQYTHYENNCLVKTDIASSKNDLTGVENFNRKKEYVYDEQDQVIEEKTSLWVPTTASFVCTQIERKTYDAAGNLATRRFFNAAEELTFSQEFEWGFNNRKIYILDEQILPEYQLFEKLESELDENGFVIEQNHTELVANGIFETTHKKFVNSCTGLIFSQRGSNQDLLSNRTFYTYDSLPECDTDGFKANIDVIPNPSNGEFGIQSNLFEFEDAKIRIFNSTGNLVFEKILNYQTFLVDISKEEIGNLVRGIYFVSIEANGFSEVKKIMISQ